MYLCPFIVHGAQCVRKTKERLQIFNTFEVFFFYCLKNFLCVIFLFLYISYIKNTYECLFVLYQVFCINYYVCMFIFFFFIIFSLVYNLIII